MDTIEIGENTRVAIGTDQILIRRGWTSHVFTLTQFIIFAVFATIFSYWVFHSESHIKAIVSACCFSGLALLGFFSLLLVKEIEIDLARQTIRRYYRIFNIKVKNRVLYKGISDVHFGWMNGQVGNLDNKIIRGYELVAYKNTNVHKDLMFFKEKTTAENLVAIFKEKLNLEIHDRFNQRSVSI